MSEFTEGVLFLKTHQEIMQSKLKTLHYKYLVKNLNDTWLVLLINQPQNYDLSLIGWFNQCSEDIPLLNFGHPADHGWGYRLYTEGQATAAVSCHYDIAFNMAIDEAEKQHPGRDVIGELFRDPAVYQEFENKVLQTAGYQKAVIEQYRYAYPDEFKVFGFSESTINNLTQILTVDWYNDVNKRLRQVVRFKEELNLREMEWVSYRYAHKD